MADEKVLSFRIDVEGVSNEAAELSKLQLQLQNLKKERAELIKQANSPGHFSSTEERLKIAAYNKEIKDQTDRTRELTKVINTADSSVQRMRAEYNKLKEEYYAVDKATREKMIPGIQKLYTEISKSEQAVGVHQRNVGNYPKIFGELSGALKGVSGEFGGLATDIMSSAGPLGIITALIGAMAAAWKRSEENVKMYLESADKLSLGDAGFDRDAEAARVDMRRRANGMIAEGFRLEKENMSKLTTFAMFYTDEQKKHFASLVAQGKQMQENGRQMRDDVRGVKDKADWTIKYNKLLQDQERLNDERLAKETEWEGLEAKLVEQRAIVSDMNASSSDQIKASVRADEIANQLASEKIQFKNKEIDNLTAIADITQKQEVYENQINALLKDRQTIQKEYYSDKVKANRLERQVNKPGVKGGAKGPSESAYDELMFGVSTQVDKFMAPSTGGNIPAEVVAEQEKQKLLDEAWKEGMQKARENNERQKALAREQYEANIDLKLQELDVDKEIADAKIAVAEGIGNVLFQIAGENRELLYGAMIAEKATAIAQIISNTGIANAKAVAVMPLTAGQPWVSINTAIAGASIAGIIAEAGRAASQINSAYKKKKAGYESGGKITGGIPVYTGTSDNLLIAVNSEEAVINKAQIARLGGSGAMRNAGIPGFETGGATSSMPYINPSVPAQRSDISGLGERISQLEVVLDIHKVRSALSETDVILKTKRI